MHTHTQTHTSLRTHSHTNEDMSVCILDHRTVCIELPPIPKRRDRLGRNIHSHTNTHTEIISPPKNTTTHVVFLTDRNSDTDTHQSPRRDAEGQLGMLCIGMPTRQANIGEDARRTDAWISHSGLKVNTTAPPSKDNDVSLPLTRLTMHTMHTTRYGWPGGSCVSVCVCVCVCRCACVCVCVFVRA